MVYNIIENKDITNAVGGKNEGEIKMKKEFIKKILNDRWYDTAKYRYIAKQDSNTGEMIIVRIERRVLDTTAALTDASATNPDGWRIVYRR